MSQVAVDCPTPEQMPAWLRETAANTRAHAHHDRTAGYVALRLDQAANMIERLCAQLTEARTLTLLSPCEKHSGLTFTTMVSHCPPVRTVCPICEPPRL